MTTLVKTTKKFFRRQSAEPSVASPPLILPFNTPGPYPQAAMPGPPPDVPLPPIPPPPAAATNGDHNPKLNPDMTGTHVTVSDRNAFSHYCSLYQDPRNYPRPSEYPMPSMCCLPFLSIQPLIPTDSLMWLTHTVANQPHPHPPHLPTAETSETTTVDNQPIHQFPSKTPPARAKVLPWVQETQHYEFEETPGMVGPYESSVKALSIVSPLGGGILGQPLELQQRGPPSRYTFDPDTGTLTFASLAGAEKADNQQTAPQNEARSPGASDRTPGRTGDDGAAPRSSPLQRSVLTQQAQTPKKERAKRRGKNKSSQSPTLNEVAPAPPTRPPRPQSPQIEVHYHQQTHEHVFSPGEAMEAQQAQLAEREEARAATLARLEAQLASMTTEDPVPSPKNPDQRLTGDTVQTMQTSTPSFGHLWHKDGKPVPMPLQLVQGAIPLGATAPTTTPFARTVSNPMGQYNIELENIRESPEKLSRSAYVETASDEGDQNFPSPVWSSPAKERGPPTPLVEKRQRGFPRQSEPTADDATSLSPPDSPKKAVSIVPTSATEVGKLVDRSSFHDDTLCQLLDAARLNLIGEEAKKALMRAARARVIELKDLKQQGEVLDLNNPVTPPLNIKKGKPPKDEAMGQKRVMSARYAAKDDTPKAPLHRSAPPVAAADEEERGAPEWAQEILTRLASVEGRLPKSQDTDGGQDKEVHNLQSQDIQRIYETIFNILPQMNRPPPQPYYPYPQAYAQFSQPSYTPDDSLYGLQPQGSIHTINTSQPPMSHSPVPTIPAHPQAQAQTYAPSHPSPRTVPSAPQVVPTSTLPQQPCVATPVQTPKTPQQRVVTPSHTPQKAGSYNSDDPSPVSQSTPAGPTINVQPPTATHSQVTPLQSVTTSTPVAQQTPQVAPPMPVDRDLPPLPDSSTSYSTPQRSQHTQMPMTPTNPHIAPVPRTRVVTSPGTWSGSGTAGMRSPPAMDNQTKSSQALDSPTMSHSAPWDLVTQRLYSWALVWEEETFTRALKNISLGHEVEEFPLTVFAMMTFKRNMKNRMTSNPPQQCDKLFVPPNIGDAINKAVHARRFSDAQQILEELWYPFQFNEPPRIVIALTRHGVQNGWLASRYDLRTGRLTSRYVSHEPYREDEIDGRPFMWWHPIRQAWPIASDNLEQTIKTNATHPEYRDDNSLRAAAMARNLLLGFRPEADCDLIKLREYIWNEVKRLAQKKRQGNLIVHPDK